MNVLMNRLLRYIVTKSALKFPVKKISHEPIFISGCPRSGTTISFQIIVENFDLCFFTNLDKKNRFLPILNHLILNRTINYSPSSFESNHGDIKGGKNAPSDGWGIFHRMFSYYYNPKKNKNLLDFKIIVSWLQHIHQKPFVVKNNANSLRIKELHQLFPSALFVHIERGIEETVYSILKGMEKSNIGKQQFWGTGPDADLFDYTFESQLEKAVFQYQFIENYVDMTEEQNVGLNIIRIKYPTEIKNLQIINRIKENYSGGGLKERNFNVDSNFFSPISKIIPQSTIDEIRNCKDEMDKLSKQILRKV